MAVLTRVAATSGLDSAELTSALTSRRYQPRVWEEHLEAMGQGIHGIPAFLIPGQAPIVGAVPYADLARAVDRALGAPEVEGEGSSKSGIIQAGTAYL
jgi:predicted DsbA family dithiol-disulfide isomerase